MRESAADLQETGSKGTKERKGTTLDLVTERDEAGVESTEEVETIEITEEETTLVRGEMKESVLPRAGQELEMKRSAEQNPLQVLHCNRLSPTNLELIGRLAKRGGP